MTGHEPQDPEEADLVVRVRGVRPGHIRAAVGATLLPAHAGPDDHGAFSLAPLLQPADTACWGKGAVRTEDRLLRDRLARGTHRHMTGQLTWLRPAPWPRSGRMPIK